MRRIVILPLILIFMTLLLTGIAHIAPNWTERAGLDFWNLRSVVNHLQDEESKGKRLDCELDQSSMRREVVDRIVLDLCNYRITLDEAVDLMIPIIKSDATWYTQLQYDLNLQGASVSSDRDLATYFLYRSIDGMLSTAKLLGDESRAAAIAERLAHFESETQEHKNSSAPLNP